MSACSTPIAPNSRGSAPQSLEYVRSDVVGDLLDLAESNVTIASTKQRIGNGRAALNGQVVVDGSSVVLTHTRVCIGSVRIRTWSSIDECRNQMRKHVESLPTNTYSTSTDRVRLPRSTIRWLRDIVRDS